MHTRNCLAEYKIQRTISYSPNLINEPEFIACHAYFALHEFAASVTTHFLPWPRVTCASLLLYYYLTCSSHIFAGSIIILLSGKNQKALFLIFSTLSRKRSRFFFVLPIRYSCAQRAIGRASEQRAK